MATSTLSSRQRTQEQQYDFPHHYIPEYKNGFRTSIFSSFAINYASMLEFILKRLSTFQFNSICDVGTGDGRLVRELAIQFPNAEVIGIDYSDKAITLAKIFNPELNFICADIISDPIGKTFEVITLIEVFEHLPLEVCSSFSKALAELLVKDGQLLITVPHNNIPVGVDKKHYQHFTPESLYLYFKPYFKIKEVLLVEQKNIINKLIRRCLKNKLFILNNKYLLNMLYKIYVHYCFLATEKRAMRIFLHLEKN